ncbi:ATP-binding cassette domain-containing protein [Streptomyces monashensis]|uniref:ATP-binding cassette domain-containing protein n=1 Tax=Streptomyces monashensis TaxID=1678012 RepID=UPI0033D42664
MSVSWLGYPQVMLAVWCPAVTVGLWHLLRRPTVRLPARERFVLAVGTALTPLLAMTVPYLPHSPLRAALPWRAPIAWGISNGITNADPARVLSAVGAQLMLAASIVPLVSLAVSFAAGAVRVVRTARTVTLLAPRRCGDVWIVDDLGDGAGGDAGRAARNLASTVGLARPRIILSATVAESPEASAVIRHEQAHARSRHPLWIFLATCALRSWWWIPGRTAILGEMTAVTPSAPVIETRGLSKVFRRQAAVDSIDLVVRPGRIYGLLGPNGAGKSTTLKMILGLLPPTGGQVRLFGRPWERQALSRIGASINGPSFHGHLSARQNLVIHALLLGPGTEVDRTLDTAGLNGTGRKKAKSFSTGMKGRLALAVAMLGTPDLLVLDEPQNGLDPEGIVALRTMMRGFTDTGRTIVLSSHLLGEVASVADDIGLITQGRLRYQGSLTGLAPDGDLERAYFTQAGAPGGTRAVAP